MLAVHILYEHSADRRPHGSSYIRLLQPLYHSQNASNFRVSQGTTYEGGADVVIVERSWHPGFDTEQALQLLHQIRRERGCLILTLDDNLFDLDLSGVADYPLPKLMALRLLAKHADGIIVSTEPLKQRLATFNRRIVVVPNALDESLFPTLNTRRTAETGTHRRIVGYMGTFTHDADLRMILQPLRTVLRRFDGTIEFQIIGGFAHPDLLLAFADLPVRILDVGEHGEYPDFIRWMGESARWDVGLAPLEENQFTRCKSDIKFLDYSLLGIPGIYSNVPPYMQSVRHDDTGLLAENTPDSWTEALVRIIEDDTLRARLRTNAYNHVASERTLRHRAHDWAAAVSSLATKLGR